MSDDRTAYSREYARRRYANDPEWRRHIIDYQQAYAKRRAAIDPEYAQRKDEIRQRYYDRHSERRAAYQRAWYQRKKQDPEWVKARTQTLTDEQKARRKVYAKAYRERMKARGKADT